MDGQRKRYDHARPGELLNPLLPGPELGVGDTALLVISAVLVALFAATVVFSGYAVLLRKRHEARDRLWAGFQERWEAPVLNALVAPDTIPDVHGLVDPEYELHFVQFVLEYTRRVRGPERQTLSKLAAPFLPAIAERADHRSPEVRTRAVQTLGMLGLPEYADQVLAGLDDESPLVSFVAARHLARPDLPQHGVALLDHLARYKDADSRFLASMLVAVGAPMIPELRARLSDPSVAPWERAILADALIIHMDPGAADIAAEALATADDRELIARLLRLIAIIGRPEHRDVVLGLVDSNDPLLRGQAFRALGSIGDDRDLAILIAGVDDESPWVALHAARGVRDAGGRAVLVDLVATDPALASLAGQILAEESER